MSDSAANSLKSPLIEGSRDSIKLRLKLTTKSRLVSASRTCAAAALEMPAEQEGL